MADNQIYIEELAKILFKENHIIWSEEEIKKEWDSNPHARQGYLRLAEISFRYFQSIYYSL